MFERPLADTLLVGGRGAIDFTQEGPMGPVQGSSGIGSTAALSNLAPKAQAVAAPKPESQESSQAERLEVQRSAQEVGEGQSSNAQVGTRINTMA
jgi:hypothetical protein